MIYMLGLDLFRIGAEVEIGLVDHLGLILQMMLVVMLVI